MTMEKIKLGIIGAMESEVALLQSLLEEKVCRKVGKHMECSCFEIKYIMTASRIYSISKIQNVSLNLQNCNK